MRSSLIVARRCLESIAQTGSRTDNILEAKETVETIAPDILLADSLREVGPFAVEVPAETNGSSQALVTNIGTRNERTSLVFRNTDGTANAEFLLPRAILNDPGIKTLARSVSSARRRGEDIDRALITDTANARGKSKRDIDTEEIFDPAKAAIDKEISKDEFKNLVSQGILSSGASSVKAIPMSLFFARDGNPLQIKDPRDTSKSDGGALRKESLESFLDQIDRIRFDNLFMEGKAQNRSLIFAFVNDLELTGSELQRAQTYLDDLQGRFDFDMILVQQSGNTSELVDNITGILRQRDLLTGKEIGSLTLAFSSKNIDQINLEMTKHKNTDINLVQVNEPETADEILSPKALCFALFWHDLMGENISRIPSDIANILTFQNGILTVNTLPINIDQYLNELRLSEQAKTSA
jgi:hypothetical protein